MQGRVRVFGNTAIVIVLHGRPGDADTGLVLNGEMACYDLASELVAAGDRIKENNKKACQEPKRKLQK